MVRNCNSTEEKSDQNVDGLLKGFERFLMLLFSFPYIPNSGQSLSYLLHRLNQNNICSKRTASCTKMPACLLMIVSPLLHKNGECLVVHFVCRLVLLHISIDCTQKIECRSHLKAALSTFFLVDLKCALMKWQTFVELLHFIENECRVVEHTGNLQVWNRICTGEALKETALHTST